jgi:bifunctional DNA-binding transcriptional regulator/antitoxin component of YhaV-PrlF toxin-antitoxin module
MRAKVKKWGNSLGLIIPANVASKEGIKEGDEVEYQLKKCSDVKELFGKYPMGNIQEIKNELRKEWALND